MRGMVSTGTRITSASASLLTREAVTIPVVPILAAGIMLAAQLTMLIYCKDVLTFLFCLYYVRVSSTLVSFWNQV